MIYSISAWAFVLLSTETPTGHPTEKLSNRIVLLHLRRNVLTSVNLQSTDFSLTEHVKRYLENDAFRRS